MFTSPSYEVRGTIFILYTILLFVTYTLLSLFTILVVIVSVYVINFIPFNEISSDLDGIFIFSVFLLPLSFVLSFSFSFYISTFVSSFLS